MIFIITILSITSFLLYEEKFNDTYRIMPFIGLFAVYSIRLIPSINKIIYAYQSLKFKSVAIEVILNEIDESEKNTHNLGLKKLDNFKLEDKLVLQNIDFEYQKNKPIFSNLNFEIR